MPKVCHCEEANGRRGALSAKREEVPLGCNLGKALTILPIALPRSSRVLRDCHVASLLAMTHQGGAVVHQRPPAVEWLCTRRSVTALQAGNACSANSLTQHPHVCHSEERSDVGISRSGLRFRRGLYVIRPCTARLPRRFAPRNDTSGSAVVYQRPPTVELPCTGRSLSAATVKFDSDCVRRHSVYIGSAFPRLPRPLWGLAMTIREPFPF